MMFWSALAFRLEHRRPERHRHRLAFDRHATDGDIIFQTGVKNGTNGATAATPTTALTIKGETQEAIHAGPVRLKGYTVSTLPSGNQGDTAFVTDATSCTFLGALTGSGSTVCPVSITAPPGLEVSINRDQPAPCESYEKADLQQSA
jgi:hypothetical protein